MVVGHHLSKHLGRCAFRENYKMFQGVAQLRHYMTRMILLLNGNHHHHQTDEILLIFSSSELER
jgi:hypothetical protein